MQNKDTSKRAAQFLSFDALKGFREQLKKKERIVVNRKILMEDSLIELNTRIHEVRSGMMVQIIYYDIDEYVQLEGLVAKIDLEYKKSIQIVNKVILLKDISSISFV